jgi:hypothetical protein
MIEGCMQFLLIGCYLVDVNFQSNVYVMILLTVFQVLTMLRFNLMYMFSFDLDCLVMYMNLNFQRKN